MLFRSGAHHKKRFAFFSLYRVVGSGQHRLGIYPRRVAEGGLFIRYSPFTLLSLFIPHPQKVTTWRCEREVTV